MEHNKVARSVPKARLLRERSRRACARVCPWPWLLLAVMTLSISTRSLAQHSYSERALLTVANHLVHKRFKQFQVGIRDFLLGPDGDLIHDKSSYEVAMQEVLAPLEPEFVVVQSAVGDHLLIPQCRSVHERALVIEYRVVPPRTPRHQLAETLWSAAQDAREEIDRRGYPAFPAAFRHVREIVKVGVAFHRRNWTALSYGAESVNGAEGPGRAEPCACEPAQDLGLDNRCR